jgi:hypothetical protein
VDAAICAPVLPAETKLEAHDHGAVRLAAQRHRGLVVHLDHVGSLDHREAVAVLGQRRKLTAKEIGQRLFHHLGAPHELNAVGRVELGEGVQRAGHGRPGSKIAPHGVQRDARQC